MDDVALNKSASLERSIARVRELHAGDDRNLTDDLTKQEAIILNIQRACETAIDLAMHWVRRDRLGIPQESRDAFDLLTRAGRLPPELAETLKKMVGFRNVAVHDYQKLSLVVVRAIIARHLEDLRRFSEAALRALG